MHKCCLPQSLSKALERDQKHNLTKKLVELPLCHIDWLFQIEYNLSARHIIIQYYRYKLYLRNNNKMLLLVWIVLCLGISYARFCLGHDDRDGFLVVHMQLLINICFKVETIKGSNWLQKYKECLTNHFKQLNFVICLVSDILLN